MSNILGDYTSYILNAVEVINSQGIQTSELVQCDMINYECSTNERYDEVKNELLQSAKLLSEIEHGGRLISVFQADPLLQAGNWRVPHIELLQPKPTRENIDGIDGIFFVTSLSLSEFLSRHQDINFETKGLANKANPYIELKVDGVAVKFHDRHMGAVLEIERMLATE
ncbi:MAG: putative dihydroxybiphenyl dioxygenase [Candidatus Saccharibacteria bacterium]|nr:putative dihydroxybiphenyl dioxygenase [Candidatus Saccharibacteria bacterium]